MLLPRDENNPILYIEELPRFSWRRPLHVPGAVHVYLSRGDRLFWPEGGFTLGELWLVRPSRLYVVDVSTYDGQMSHDVTGASGTVTVSLVVTFSWQVIDPRFVVKSHLVDVMAILPHHVGAAIDAVVEALSWSDATELNLALKSGGMPERVRAEGIEISTIRAAVVSLGDDASAIAGGDG
ncbi:hypothetical protein [Paractinoplanes durhamensis]|uniref:Band 7 domain-containing protein n=1 Tax=Paractinoplanes durhamensis TaxID=113563 RepID=A0ABQ3YS17_9ACTN|nr:hypothetical protein [Actinoplanes durhamensis]GIE00164.1 hypothetical protein Adu01nite_15140 [Actinoplanes durhamensis]